MRKILYEIYKICAFYEIDVAYVSRVPNAPAHWMGCYDGDTIFVVGENFFVLLHEFCHCMQDKTGTLLWKQYLQDDAYTGQMERECEQMAIGLLHMYGYDVEKYATLAEEHLSEHYGVTL